MKKATLSGVASIASKFLKFAISKPSDIPSHQYLCPYFLIAISQYILIYSQNHRIIIIILIANNLYHSKLFSNYIPYSLRMVLSVMINSTYLLLQMSIRGVLAFAIRTNNGAISLWRNARRQKNGIHQPEPTAVRTAVKSGEKTLILHL
ncbi:MAG: hypothetical protein IKV28_00755 [Bacteroidales bacterium]|nr:hypothetical protein [Bacteroidales bacterium]